MIFKDSRYANVPVYTIVDAQGRAHRALRMRVIPPTPAYFQHLVAETDRLDLMAFTYYAKPDRFWRICDGNSEMQPERLLEPGRRVLVPPDRT
jgi:hypothetical protein